MTEVAHPPETVEGWFALHQIYRIPAGAARDVIVRRAAAAALGELAHPAAGGWSATVPLIGSTAGLMLMHFRPTLDELGDVQRRLASDRLFGAEFPLEYSFLSVTEAGLYHVTAELARAAAARGGAVGDTEYAAAVAERVAAERGSAHVQRRLYPPIPEGMPYVCFYPMTKRRDAGQNWYTLSLDERSRLMYAHGMTGRRYAGKVVQVITGAIGFDAWEWGVTLFAADPMQFKKLVTDMRFDEVSAKYAEFGDFYVGKLAEPGAWLEGLP